MRFSCADRVLEKIAKVQVVCVVPVRHHWIVGVHEDGIDHHDLIVAVEVLEPIHGLAEIHRLVHHRVIHPSSRE